MLRRGCASLFKPIRTNVPGIDFCDQLPLLARQADKLAVLRSLTHGSNVHEPSVYHMLTGKQNPGLVVPRNARRRSDFPFIGSVVSAFTPPGELPAAVTVPRPIGHDGVTYAGTYAGFLGPRHDPMEPKAAPNPGQQAVHPLTLAADLSPRRVVARRGLLSVLESHERRLQKATAAEALGSFHEQAFRMLALRSGRPALTWNGTPPRCTTAMAATIRREFPAGPSPGRGRRRLVTVTWIYIFPHRPRLHVWDNHAGYGITERRRLRPAQVAGVHSAFDRGLSALLDDLEQRACSTRRRSRWRRVRTPKQPTRPRPSGRLPVGLFAGGGIKGGPGLRPRQRLPTSIDRVSPADFLATICHALGIAAAQRDPRPRRPALSPYRWHTADGPVLMPPHDPLAASG